MTVFRPLANALFGESRVRDLLRETGIVALLAASDLRLRLKFRSDRKALAQMAGPLLLNVGSGWKRPQGWINLDISPKKPGIVFYDAHDPLPVRDGAVAHIHTEHFLEHLAYDRAIAFLRDCHRALQPGGTLRVIVPDAEKYFRAYVADDRPFFEVFKTLGGPREPFETKAQIINQMFRMGGVHRFAWDYETLALALSQAGFSRVERSRQHDTSHDIDGTDTWRPIESLYVNSQR